MKSKLQLSVFAFIIPYISLPFENLLPTLPTMQLDS